MHEFLRSFKSVQIKRSMIKKKNTKNIRRIFRAPISMMAKWIRLKFGMECILPQGTFHSKNGAVLLSYYLVIDVWKRRFLGSSISYLSVVHPYWQYLATRHAIMCLDSDRECAEQTDRMEDIIVAIDSIYVITSWCENIWSILNM